MTDFSFQGAIGRLEELALLLLLGAIIYSAVAYAKRRPGVWPPVYGWSALGALLSYAVILVAQGVLEALRASDPPRENPDVPVSHETWHLLGGVTTLLFGVALLMCGVAFVYVGWSEKRSGGRGRSKRKRA